MPYRMTGALALGALLALRHRRLRRVPPELRSPFLYVPLPINGTVVRLERRLKAVLKATPRDGVRVLQVPGVAGPRPVRHYAPHDRRAHGALLWIHGGGRVLGSPGVDDELCRRFADSAGVEVVSVDYRLAPEAPFPAALDDSMDVLHWLVSKRGIPAEDIAVGGASAGGGLAAEVAQRAHDEGLHLALQLLVYPMLDDRTLSHGPADRGRLVWTPAANRFGWSSYLGHAAGADETRPYAVAARREDLEGLAPVWIGVGDLDLFHDEDVTYARRLRAAGVAVTLHVVPGMYHGADALPGVRHTPAMQDFRARACEALVRAMEGGRVDRGEPRGRGITGSRA